MTQLPKLEASRSLFPYSMSAQIIFFSRVCLSVCLRGGPQPISDEFPEEERNQLVELILLSCGDILFI